MNKSTRMRLKGIQYIVSGLKEMSDANALPEKQQVVVDQAYGYMKEELAEQRIKASR
jgi:hypothetical protein